jgi:CRISPR system Cascade subunit CasC
MGRRVIDVHILQTVAPSNRNANATAWPKSTSYGGVRRARVSIEQCSYVVRAEFGRALVDSLLGERTRRTGQAIAEPIMAIPPGFRDRASAFARAVLKAANLVEDESKETHAGSPAQRLSAAWAVGEGGRK